MRSRDPRLRAGGSSLALVFLLGLAACGGGAGAPASGLPVTVSTAAAGGGGGSSAPPPTPTPTPAQGDDGTLVGGFLLAMEQAGEPFYVRITNPAAVSVMIEVLAGTRTIESVSGPILANGPGAPAYYFPWSWHSDPARVVLNQPPAAADRYDGSPSEVEANLQTLLAAGTSKAVLRPAAVVRVIHDLRFVGGPGPIGPPVPPLPR